MTTATTIPASVRHKNPGAMGLGASAKLFGATKVSVLDKAGNTIATFPTMVDGAGAIFHLLHSKGYLGLTIWDAMHKWGDGKALEAKGKVMQGRLRTDGYVTSIERYSRFKRSDKVTAGWLEDAEQAIEFAKAMARHEAGCEYPMTDMQWCEAHAEFMTVLGGGYIQLDKTKPVAVLAPLNLARTHLGEHEIAGAQHNPFIVGCFEEIGSSYRTDETSWCAAFVSAVLKRAGCAYIAGDAGCSARNYLKYGHALDEPEEGCLVVFWRVSPNGWQGHVAIVESWTATTLTIIGGNQANAVTRMTVPRTGPKSQVLGYRRPVSGIVPTSEIVRDTSMKRKLVGAIGAIITFSYAIWDWIVQAVQVVGEMIGALPQTAAQVNSMVGASQQIAESAGFPLPVKICLLLTVLSLAFGAYGTWKRLRQSKGELTKPPYETDEAPVATAEDAEDLFAANVVSLEAERAKRAPKSKSAKPKGARKTTKRKRAA